VAPVPGGAVLTDIPEPRYAKTSDDTHIAYLVMGDGPIDLVYAFGYMSNIDADADVPFHAEFRQRLASFARLILFDRRGTGLSDRSGVGDAGSLEAGMDDIRAVMDASGSERALLLGLTDGGMLSALFAASHPDRTLGLVLWRPSARGKRAPDYPWGETDQEWESYLDEVERTWGSIAFAENDLGDTVPEGTLTSTLLKRLARMFRAAASPGSAAAMLRTLRDSDLRAVLPTVQVPTLVINPADHPSIEEARYAASLIPGATFVTVPGSERLPFWTSSDLVIDRIQRFAEVIRHEEASMNRVLATVLFTDVVGSTTKAIELGDRAWSELVERHHAIVRAMLGRYRGSEVDTAGDGFFATFDGPARGVRCALAIVEAIRPLGLEVRAGLHTGEVETIDGKVGGIAAHIGARVGALAGASEILVSSTVKDLVVGSGLVFADVGKQDLKGVPDRWQLYRVVKE
jgi:pimeloyl-ACP methyl ester carboxylesterase